MDLAKLFLIENTDLTGRKSPNIAILGLNFCSLLDFWVVSGFCLGRGILLLLFHLFFRGSVLHNSPVSVALRLLRLLLSLYLFLHVISNLSRFNVVVCQCRQSLVRSAKLAHVLLLYIGEHLIQVLLLHRSSASSATAHSWWSTASATAPTSSLRCLSTTLVSNWSHFWIALNHYWLSCRRYLLYHFQFVYNQEAKNHA